MNVEYSRQFFKAAQKLTGKYRVSLKKIICEVKLAGNFHEVPGCKKLVTFRDHYRIKMGDYRLIILLIVKENSAVFELLVSRGEVYNKENEKQLRKKK
jgi:mRNA-degrading endonuclease RelE of RelBE toxin-antitoxin system